MSVEELRVFLVQFRPDAMREHERQMILKHAELEEDQLLCIDALSDALHHELLHGAHAVIVGGSGDYFLSQGDIAEKVANVIPFLQTARQNGIPTIGIGFGALVIALAFGGRICKDDAQAEMGTFAVAKHPAAAHCPIFRELPDVFDAQLGHKEQIVELPFGAVSLASSARTQHQAFTFPGEPVYGFAFHPELDKTGLLERLAYYAKSVDSAAEVLAEPMTQARESTESVKVLKLFFRGIVAGGERYGANVQENGRETPEMVCG